MIERYAIVTTGRVVNVVLWDAEAEPDWHPGEIEGQAPGVVPCGAEVQIGWHHADGVFSPPPPLPLPPPPPVEIVSASQAKIALFNAGLLASVEALVAAHPYEPVRIWYHAANQWEAAHPYVVAIGYELGLSAEQIQDLFDAAALQ